ncbi:MAG: carboxypeptidase-like regulatory domain-containing protein [Acidobacteriota bacterium]|nr:carboxypeptidase-like regulatory domain-containing protein [Acidobacteriota bacterium]
MPKRKNINGIVALLAAIFGFGYVILVITSESLRTNPFVQGITGVIIAACIATVLFTVTSSEALIKLPIGVSGIISVTGAAGFYIILLQPLKDIIFPYYTFSGYVAYEDRSQPEDVFTPVAGANVGIKDTGLETKTSDKGEFTFARVPAQATVKELIVNYAGASKIFEVKKVTRGIYRIPREEPPKESTKTTIKAEEWKEQPDGKCSSEEKNKFTTTRQFSLIKSIPRMADYSDLFISVLLIREGVEIIDANLLEPQIGVEEMRSNLGYARERKWALEIKGDISVRIDVCLGAVGKGTQLTPSSLNTSYWFQKVG